MAEKIISTEQNWLQADCDFSALNSVCITSEICVAPHLRVNQRYESKIFLSVGLHRDDGAHNN